MQDISLLQRLQHLPHLLDFVVLPAVITTYMYFSNTNIVCSHINTMYKTLCK